MRLGGGREGGRWRVQGGGVVVCLCDTESERESDRREGEKEREGEEPVCSFHLLISFPGGSIISCSRGGKRKRRKKRKKTESSPAVIFSHRKPEPQTSKKFF